MERPRPHGLTFSLEPLWPLGWLVAGLSYRDALFLAMRRKNKSVTLGHKRGITSRAAPKTLKPQKTRKLIRRFHVLLKNKNLILRKLGWTEEAYHLTKASQKRYDKGLEGTAPATIRLENVGGNELVEVLGQIDGEIEKNGGIEVYQKASQQGQSTQRGSDSSKRLVDWLNEGYKLDKKLSALEIGCLSPTNFISTSKIFDTIVRIDLNSQHHLILQQDFMQRPLPQDDTEKFNLISCSLVLNFVPSPEERGEMLRRITKFLKQDTLSALFLVLPLPCISNSRYLTHDRLLEIMGILGFRQKFYHQSSKLAYWLFDWSGEVKSTTAKKQLLVDAPNRNNFSVVLGGV